MAELSDADIKRIAQAIAAETGAKIPGISHDEASKIAAAAAKEAVHQYSQRFFGLLGYNMDKDDDIRRLRANLDFGEMLRRTSTVAANAIVKAVAVAIVLGLVGWMIVGAKTSIGAHSPPPVK
jgi:hypothetical protein